MTAAELVTMTKVAAAVLGPTEAHVTLGCRATEAEVREWAAAFSAPISQHLTTYKSERPVVIFAATKTLGTVEFTLQGSRPATADDAKTMRAHAFRGPDTLTPEDVEARLQKDLAQLSSHTQRAIGGAP